MYCTQLGILIARSPNFILKSSECNFSRNFADYISYLVSNLIRARKYMIRRLLCDLRTEAKDQSVVTQAVDVEDKELS